MTIAYLRGRMGIGLVVAAVVALAAPARVATDFTVNTIADHADHGGCTPADCTLREAVDRAARSD